MLEGDAAEKSVVLVQKKSAPNSSLGLYLNRGVFSGGHKSNFAPPFERGVFRGRRVDAAEKSVVLVQKKSAPNSSLGLYLNRGVFSGGHKRNFAPSFERGVFKGRKGDAVDKSVVLVQKKSAPNSSFGLYLNRCVFSGGHKRNFAPPFERGVFRGRKGEKSVVLVQKIYLHPTRRWGYA